MSKKLKFSIQGMPCVVCANTCQKAIAKLGGVKSCNVNFASGVALVEYDENTATEKDIFAAVSKAGYKAVAMNQEGKGQNIGMLIAMLTLAFLLLAFAMLGMLGVKYPAGISADHSPIVFTVIQIVLCVPVMIMGLPFYIRGFKNIFKAKPNMDLSLIQI